MMFYIMGIINLIAHYAYLEALKIALESWVFMGLMGKIGIFFASICSWKEKMMYLCNRFSNELGALRCGRLQGRFIPPSVF